MEALTNGVRELARTADEAGRKALIDGLRDLAQSIESPGDTINRLMFLHFQIPIIRIGCDIGLFNLLGESSSALSVSALAEKTGVAPTLLARLLRYLASNGIVKESGKDSFEANNITKTLTVPGNQGGIYHYCDSIGPSVFALPEFLKENKYQDIVSNVHCPLQKGHNTDLPAFIWVQTKPENFAHFNQFMAVQRAGMATWLDVYPYADLTKSLKPDQVFFVDVGGGLGHQSIALREQLPDLPNRIILQDIPATLQHAIKHPGVEIVTQDFYEPQVIKGAKIYYMRNIIHDYPEDKALIILKNTVAALGPDSVILIDDMVLPNKGVHWQATQLDMTMMCGMAALERTTEIWQDLITKAGLKIKNTYTYTMSLNDSILEVVPI